jgi:hypothetical protein
MVDITLEQFINTYTGNLSDEKLYLIIKNIITNIHELHSLNIAHKLDINNIKNITLKEVNEDLRAS